MTGARTAAARSASSRKRPPRCPLCRRPAVERFAPFCSRRCADDDLARWLDGAYAIAGEERVGIEPEDDGGSG